MTHCLASVGPPRTLWVALRPEGGSREPDRWELLDNLVFHPDGIL